MKRAFTVLLLLIASSVYGQQETQIKVLGVYPSQLSYDPIKMTLHLQALVKGWNDTGLPGAAITTITLLNSGVAVPMHYPGTVPATAEAMSTAVYSAPALFALRTAWQADVIIVFSTSTKCGATKTAWHSVSPFVAGPDDLDLRPQNTHFVSVVFPGCETWVTPHEFGHLAGGDHATSGKGLFADSRANMFHVPQGQYTPGMYLGTALLDPSDHPLGNLTVPSLDYSRNESGKGDATRNNKRTLAWTARSLANFFAYPPGPPVLNPPINLIGYNLGCVNGVDTRHDLYWADDPATNITPTHYEIWKSQPVGQPFIYGWTAFPLFSQSYVSGVTARARVNACSGPACTALSTSFYDADPVCNW